MLTIKYMVMSRDKNAGRSHNIRVDSSSFERADDLKYLGTILTEQNYIQEEIKRSFTSGNACCHSVQNFLFSSLLSKNINIKIHRNIILPVVLYGCETWSLTMNEERRLRGFEKRVLGKIFGPKRDKVTGKWRKLHKEELNDLHSSSNVIRVAKSRIKS